MRAVALSFVLLTENAETVHAAMAAVRAWGMPGYGDTDLGWDRQSRAADRAREAVSAIGPGLDALQRERFLTDALRIALADGPVQPAEDSLVRSVGTWLGLTKANVDGVVAQVLADRAN
jgi:hypothetical protein